MLLFQTSLSAGIAKKQEDINQPTAQQQKAAEIHFNAAEKVASNLASKEKMMDYLDRLAAIKKQGGTIAQIRELANTFDFYYLGEADYAFAAGADGKFYYVNARGETFEGNTHDKDDLTELEKRGIKYYDYQNSVISGYADRHGNFDYKKTTGEHITGNINNPKDAARLRDFVGEVIFWQIKEWVERQARAIKAQATTPKGGGPQKTQVTQTEGGKRDETRRTQKQKAKGKIPKTTTPGEEQAEERRKHYAEEPHSPNTEFFKPVA